MKLRYKFAIGLLAIVAAGITAIALAMSHTADCEPVPELSKDGEQMKAILARCYGAPDILEFTNVTKPSPASDEVLVKVQAASVNPLDWHQMRGSPYIVRLGGGLGAPTDPRMGVDFAGTVEAVGTDVTGFKPGDEVFGGAGGAFAEYVTVRETRAVVHKPANMSFEQAATVPIAAITALQALRDKGQLQAGQKVLINGAGGGIGTVAVQIAKTLEAEVTAVDSSAKLDMLRSIGADHVIDFNREDFTRNGVIYDVIIDVVGTSPFSRSLKSLQTKGRYILGNPRLPGMLKGLWTSMVSSKNVIIALAAYKTEDLVFLKDLIEAEKIKPVIDRSFPLERIADAHRYVETGQKSGNVVISVATNNTD